MNKTSIHARLLIFLASEIVGFGTNCTVTPIRTSQGSTDLFGHLLQGLPTLWQSDHIRLIRSCPCRLRINRACLSGATTKSSIVRSRPLPFASQGRVKATYPAWGHRCSAQPYNCQPHSRLTALVAGATVARGTGAPLSRARHGRSGLLPWPAYRDATVWASHSRWWARAGVTVGVGRHAATRRYRRHEGSVANFDFRGKSENLVSAIQ
jgi:hypothetical protein